MSNEEVRKAMFHVKPCKALGPNGFPAGFYQKSWGVIGANDCEFVLKMWINRVR